METNTTYTVNAKVVINATGVFTDAILKMDNAQSKDIVRPSQGIHLVLGENSVNFQFNKSTLTVTAKQNLDKFFNQRLENLSSKTKENYLRGFSSMIKGLEQQNIYIPLHLEDKSFFDDRVKIVKSEANIIIENRYINNVNDVIKNLYEDRYISGLIAEIQYELSIRQSEAFELVKNPNKYLDNGYIVDLVGKGNHKYMAKEISFELEQKLLNNSYDLIDKSTYYNDLQKYDISSHDFRFTSARDKFEEKIKNGISEKEAKLQISQELNHKREAITDYYLKRTK